MFRTAFTLLALTTLGACADDHPPIEQTNAPDEEVREVFALNAPDKVQVCEPGAARDCWIYERESLGTVTWMSCHRRAQHCRADGFGWLACGEPAEAPLSVASPDAGTDAAPPAVH